MFAEGEFAVHIQALKDAARELRPLMPVPTKRRRDEDPDADTWHKELDRLLCLPYVNETKGTIYKAFKLLAKTFCEWIDGLHSCVFTSVLPWTWTNRTSPAVFRWSRDSALRKSDAQAFRSLVEGNEGKNRTSFMEQMVTSVWLMTSLGQHGDWAMRNVVVGGAPDDRALCVAIVDFARFDAHAPKLDVQLAREDEGAYVFASRRLVLEMLSNLDRHFDLPMTLGDGGNDRIVVEACLEKLSDSYLSVHRQGASASSAIS